jgi:hypothetical protein
MVSIVVREVDWGVANRFKDGTIEVNKNLKKYPKIYKETLRHELGHDDSTFSMKDFKHDLLEQNSLVKFGVAGFMARHPKALTQLSPITYSKHRGWMLDINLSIFYGVLLILVGGALFFGLKFF